MPLICPECKQSKAFFAIGIVGKMKCFDCNTILSIDDNYVEARNK